MIPNVVNSVRSGDSRDAISVLLTLTIKNRNVIEYDLASRLVVLLVGSCSFARKTLDGIAGLERTKRPEILYLVSRVISLKYARTPFQNTSVEMVEVDRPELNASVRVVIGAAANAFTWAATRMPNVPTSKLVYFFVGEQ